MLMTFYKWFGIGVSVSHLYTPIGNVMKFIEYNIEVAKAQNGNPTYRPYLNRVIELMKYLKQNE